MGWRANENHLDLVLGTGRVRYMSHVLVEKRTTMYCAAVSALDSLGNKMHFCTPVNGMSVTSRCK